MDMAGLKKSLCGLDIEKETSGTKALLAVINTVNDNIDGENDGFAESMSMAMIKTLKHRIEQNGDEDDVALPDSADNARFNILHDTMANIVNNAPDLNFVADAAVRATYSSDEEAAEIAQNLVDEVDWGEGIEDRWSEQPAKKPEEKPAGPVHVEAHTRDGIQVKAYDRSPPKTGGDALVTVSGTIGTGKGQMVSIGADADKAKQVISVESYLRSNPNEGGEAFVQVRAHQRGLPSKYTRETSDGRVLPKSRAEVFNDVMKAIKARLDETYLDEAQKKEALDHIKNSEAPGWTRRGEHLIDQGGRGMMHMKMSDKLMSEKFSTKVNDEASKSILAFETKIMEQIERNYPRPKTTGDTRINTTRCKCGRDATHRVHNKDGTNYHACGDCRTRATGDANYHHDEEIRQHEQEIAPHMRKGRIVQPYKRKPTYKKPVVTIKTGGDSLVLENQPIAKEGVLPYPDGRKLKRWEDLAVNIGREVPIVDEHPPFENGNRGLLTGKEKVWGKAIIQQCNGKKALCARVALDDGAPAKSGYSIGYEFLEEKTGGVFGSQPYDAIQKVKPINHLALTNYPRDADAKVKVAADSDCPFDKCIPTSYNPTVYSGDSLIHNTPFAHELYRFSPSARYAMDPDLSARAEKLRRAHPDMEKFALLAAADSIADETAANRE